MEFSNFFKNLIQEKESLEETNEKLNERWNFLKINLIPAAKQVCGVLQNILGRGRHGGGMVRFKKLFHLKENFSKNGRLEEVDTVTRLLNVHSNWCAFCQK